MKRLTLLLCVVLFSGCATVNKKTMDSQSLQKLQGESVSSVMRPKPDFSVMTAGKGMFGMIGALAGIADGNAIVRENNVEDPAIQISAGIVDALVAREGMRSMESVEAAARDGNSGHPPAASPRYLLDVKTINWQVIYFPTDWAHYRVIYVAVAKLVDTQTNAVVAESSCKRIPDDSDFAPTYDQLMAAHAAGLKRQLAVAASQCLRSMRMDMLGG